MLHDVSRLGCEFSSRIKTLSCLCEGFFREMSRTTSTSRPDPWFLPQTRSIRPQPFCAVRVVPAVLDYRGPGNRLADIIASSADVASVVADVAASPTILLSGTANDTVRITLRDNEEDSFL